MVGQETAEKLDVLTKRLDVLHRLTDGPAYKRDLVDDLDHSRSTINRAIDELAAVDMVRRTDDGFTATMAGRLALDRLDEFRGDLDDVVDAETVLEPLPFDAPLDADAVSGSRAVQASDPAPYRPLEGFHDDLQTASRYRALLPSLDDPRQVRLLYEHVVIQERPAELVVSPAVFRTLADEFPRQVGAMAATDGCSIHVGEPPSFVLAIVESGGSAAPATTVYVVVFTESGAVHGSLANATDSAVSWAAELFESVRAEAADRTADLVASTPAAAASVDDGGTANGGRLPVSLDRDGFVRLHADYFRAEPVSEPATAWRTGLTLPEVHTGYAIDRRPAEAEDDVSGEPDREGAGAARTLADELADALADGSDTVLTGPPGSGKSTVAKQVACAWHEENRGAVFYRESGRGRSFGSTDELATAVEAASGHVLVVVEDAVRPEASAVFDVVGRFADDERVSFLLDARETEWRDPAGDVGDVSDLTVRTMPPVHDRDAQRIVEHVERTTGTAIGVDAAQLRNRVTEAAASSDEERPPGEMLLLLHRLSTFADPLADATERTSLEASVADVYDEFSGDDLELDVCVLANALNAAGLPLQPATLHALASTDSFDAVDDAIDRLEGRVLFPREDGTYRTVHESWSVTFLAYLLRAEGNALAAERFGDCLTAYLSLADDTALRDRVARYHDDDAGTADIAEDAGGWADEVVEALLSLARKRPKLAPLFGIDRETVSLPAACSGSAASNWDVELGWALLEAGEVDGAHRRFDAVPEDDADLGFERLLGLSRVADNRREFDAAIDRAERALERASGRSRRARAKRRLGRAHANANHYEDAERPLREALETFDDLDDQRRVATTLDYLGSVASSLSEFEAAREHHERAVGLNRELGDLRGEARSLHYLGSVNLRTSDFDAAREYYERSLEINRRFGNRKAVATMLENLGIVAKHQGEYERAAEQHRRSLEISEAIDDPLSQAKSLGNLGLVAKSRGEPGAAREYYERSIEIYRDLEMAHGEAKLRCNLAEVAVELGDYEATREHVEASTAVFEDIGDSQGRAINENTLGLAALEQGNNERAAEHFRRSVELFRSAGVSKGQAESRRNLGRALAAAGDRDVARENWETALETFREIDAPEDALTTLRYQVEACRADGEEATARERVREARELLTRAPDEVTGPHREWVERAGTELDPT